MIQLQDIRTQGTTPQNVYAQANEYQLGEQGPTYKPLLSSVLAVIGMMIGVIVVDIVLFYILIVATGYIFYILIAIPIAAIVYGIYALNDCNLRVYQFANGLVRAKGEQQLDVIRWDQVAFVIQNVRRRGYGYAWGGIIGAAMTNTNTPHSINVQRTDGKVFKFGGTLRHVTQLIQTIQGAVTQAHMPRAIAAYDSGSPVTFGTFVISRQGLSNGREVLPWNEIQSVDVKNGKLLIKRTGKTFSWANVNISLIPNVLVFMSMVNYARTGRAY